MYPQRQGDTLNHNFISLETKAMVGVLVQPSRISLLEIDYVCVKVIILALRGETLVANVSEREK
jgi:hypothetical protein